MIERSPISETACCGAMLLFVLGLLLLAVRLKAVQLDSVAQLKYESSRQAVRRVQTAGGRGLILDCHGRVLAGNRLGASIVCDAAVFQRRTWEATATEIAGAITNVATAIGLEPAVEMRVIQRHLRHTLSVPMTVWRDVDDEALAKFCERAYQFPGFAVETVEERIYPNGKLAAHLLGYVGRDRGISEAGDEKFSFYDRELRGRAGIESYYDSFLRGVSGEDKLVVDARGFTTRNWTVTAPRSGPDLVLSVNLDIQREVERQLEGVKGACVVLDPRDGAVLAMGSSPSFDPNEFVPILPGELYAQYRDDPDKPLLCRAISGTYAPGSTFKTVTAIAALERNYPVDTQYECTGAFKYGSMKLRCSRTWGHGAVRLRDALRGSCNPYFCHVGLEIGTNALISTARDFGLGQRTGIDFGGEAAGVVPDGGWKMRTYNERWYPGDLIQMSIGQGMLLTTPLQMARIAAAIGTGYLVRPHIKLDFPIERKRLPFSEASLMRVRQGMEAVVNDSGGTGVRGGAGVNVRVAGKTGTAEVGRGARRRKNTWFIAYAPASAPEVAIAMVIENGDSGGGTTAPRVAAVLRQCFADRGSVAGGVK